MILNQIVLKPTRVLTRQLVIRNCCPFGSSVGKGGSDGRYFRKAEGTLGEMGAAREEEYFHKKRKEQLLKLKQNLKKEITFHEQQMRKKKNTIKQAEKELDEIE